MKPTLGTFRVCRPSGMALHRVALRFRARGTLGPGRPQGIGPGDLRRSLLRPLRELGRRKLIVKEG